jgi:general secretion pathway protein G
MNMHTSRRTPRAGFTLLEVLVVLILISLLAGTVIYNITGTIDKNSASIAKLFVDNSVKVPLVSYRINMGSYPSTEEGLQALITPPANRADRWKGPYLDKKTVPTDPWGNVYQYRVPGTKNSEGYDVWYTQKSSRHRPRCCHHRTPPPCR